MAVSGTLQIDRNTLFDGSGAITTQRGSETWGANWIFNKQGAQHDILVVAEEFKNLSTSGAYATDTELADVSGAITSNGTFVSPTLNDPTVSGDITLTGSGHQSIGASANPLSSSGLLMTSPDGTVFQIGVSDGGTVTASQA